MKHRDIACAILFDSSGRYLLQQRDDIPGILHPGKVGLFGGHREAGESFLACVMREVEEEISYRVPAERFEHLVSYEGPDFDKSGGTVHGEFFVVRAIPIEAVRVTEGALLVVEPDRLAAIEAKLAPSARFVLDSFAAKFRSAS